MSGELGAILQTFLDEHLATHAVPAHERKILRALARCGTGELGYADYHCPDCDRVERVPRSCGNRHCPRCQGRLAHAWRERQEAALLATRYFHAVFTLPHALLPLCAARPAALYRLLFDAAAETLLQLGRERLGGTPGLTAVLHTWGQQLNRHPHLHAIVTGGALDAAGHWHAAKRAGYLFPLGTMGALFRGKFLAGLNALKAAGAVPAPPAGWPQLWKKIGHSPWVVYCKKPFAGPAQVLAYLANYTHRVALSERRIVAVDEAARTVTFRWRDYRVKGSAHAAGRVQGGPPGAAQKLCTLDADEFLRRFRRHLLPHRFTKIRHYGLLANAARTRLVPRARAALAALTPAKKKREAASTHAGQNDGALPPPADAPPWPPPCAHCGGTRVAFLGLTLASGTAVAGRAVPAAVAVGAAVGREPP